MEIYKQRYIVVEIEGGGYLVQDTSKRGYFVSAINGITTWSEPQNIRERCVSPIKFFAIRRAKELNRKERLSNPIVIKRQVWP